VTNPSNPSIAQSFKPGDKLAGCYTLKELQPPQGFCTVWLAHDEELGKDILLQFVPDSVRADSRAMNELKAEAKRNRQLIHPRIVRVHDLVEDEKWAALSMDNVGGDTYAALQEKRGSRAFDPSELAPAISELCQTIEDAHRIDLFHRDLAPSNLIAADNGLMVQKFGISRAILDSLARGGQPVEASRDIAYISPQQLDAERPSRADDIYSLGASIYDLLTGAPPFNNGEIISDIRKTVPKPVSECRHAKKIAGESIPAEWDAVIAACLAKNFEDRPKSAADAGASFAAGKSTAPAPAPAAAAAAAGVATAGAAETPKPESTPAPPAGAGEAPKADAPEQEAAPKQQKRPWTPGPGKAPLITEATVLSNTPVPKGDQKPDPKAEAAKQETPAEAAAGAKKPGPGPTTPTGFPLRAFVEVEGEKRPKPKSNAGLIAAVAALILVFVIALIFYKNNGGSGTASENSAATSGTNAAPAPANLEGSPSPVAVAAASASLSPTAITTVAAVTASPAAEAASPAPETSTPPPGAVAESPAPPAAELGAMTDAQTQQLLSGKTKAVDAAKAALAAATSDAQAKATAQTQAAAAIQRVQADAKQKADAADAAKKAADDAAAKLTEQQADLQKAQADADDAAKAAAAKAQAADQLRKTVQEAQTAVQQQQTTARQAQDDAAKVAQSAVDSQKTADEAAKAAADAEKLRQQQDQALTQAQADLTQLQSSIDQARNSEKAQQAAAAAAEAARVQKEREAETARLTAQAAVAAKAAEDAQKALEAAKKAVADAEKAEADAQAQAQAAASGTLPLPEASPSPETSPAPGATPPSGAQATPAPAPGSPTLSVTAPSSNLRVDQALSNSLGMRFAPVGKIFFSIWLTRVQDFAAFAKETGYTGPEWQNPGFKQAPDHPVVNVSWNDANQFCLWLTQKEHQLGILDPTQEYRLPTDLEWSNGVGLPPESGRTPESRDLDVPDVYPWGTQWPPPPGAGNYTGEETDSDQAIKGYNDGFAWTSPVGSFNANKFGLYDMGGNVWEWCSDWWNSEQKQKVLRGGSWYNGALRISLLSSCRVPGAANLSADDYGFRVVIAKEESKGKGKGKRTTE